MRRAGAQPRIMALQQRIISRYFFHHGIQNLSPEQKSDLMNELLIPYSVNQQPYMIQKCVNCKNLCIKRTLCNDCIHNCCDGCILHPKYMSCVSCNIIHFRTLCKQCHGDGGEYKYICGNCKRCCDVCGIARYQDIRRRPIRFQYRLGWPIRRRYDMHDDCARNETWS